MALSDNVHGDVNVNVNENVNVNLNLNANASVSALGGQTVRTDIEQIADD